MKILYIYPSESWGFPSIISSFIRISNYLNSRAHEISESIEEEYIDLRHERLPKFIPKNLITYREKLKEFMVDLYERFNFDIVAISCYSSYCYINTVEVACCIKNFIDHSCKIVVGGTHASICPDDFQPGNFPEYLSDYYPIDSTPFDYLIRDEGELPFFNLINGLLNKTLHSRNNEEEKCIILKRELIEDLNTIPVINFKLYKRYKN